MPRHLDEPLVEARAQCDAATTALQALARNTTLPAQLRSRASCMYLMVRRIAREVERHPQALLEERDDDRRGPVL